MSLLGTLRGLRMFAGTVGRLPARHLLYMLGRLRNERPHRFGGQIRVNTFFPPFPSPAFERLIDNLAARRRAPHSTYIAITSECPCRCDHCSYGGRVAASMPRPQLLELIEQLKNMGACTIGFTGGEPLLRDDLEELIAACKPDLATIVFTTGHGMTLQRAQALARAGLDCLTVGIESSDPQEHDAVRKLPRSFEHAQQAIQAAAEAGIYTALSTIGTVERIDSGELERMYDLAERWGAGEFRLLAPVATGSAASCGSFMLDERRRRYLYDFHSRHNRRGRGPVVASFAYLESGDAFGCGAGYHHLFIDAAGECCPCDLTPLSFGNVLQESIVDIWQRMGQYFGRPRCGCLMGELSCKIQDSLQSESPSQPLPIPRESSEELCRNLGQTELPAGYRRLL